MPATTLRPRRFLIQKRCAPTIRRTRQCSLEECKQKCTNHAAFKCSTYAYDEAEKECYVFESCVGETDEPDYTLYVMTNRECKKGHVGRRMSAAYVLA